MGGAELIVGIQMAEGENGRGLVNAEENLGDASKMVKVNQQGGGLEWGLSGRCPL